MPSSKGRRRPSAASAPACVEHLIATSHGRATLLRTYNHRPSAPQPQQNIVFVPAWIDSDVYADVVAPYVAASTGAVVTSVHLDDFRSPRAHTEAVVRSHLDQVERAVLHAAALTGASSRVLLHGFSYGANLSARLAPRLPLDSLVLQAGVLYPADTFRSTLTTPRAAIDERTHAYRRSEIAPDDDEALRNILRADCDILVVRHGSDEVAPAQTAANFVRAGLARPEGHGTTSYVEVPGAIHYPSSDGLRRTIDAGVVRWARGRSPGAQHGVGHWRGVPAFDRRPAGQDQRHWTTRSTSSVDSPAPAADPSGPGPSSRARSARTKPRGDARLQPDDTTRLHNDPPGRNWPSL